MTTSTAAVPADLIIATLLLEELYSLDSHKCDYAHPGGHVRVSKCPKCNKYMSHGWVSEGYTTEGYFYKRGGVCKTHGEQSI